MESLTASRPKIRTSAKIEILSGTAQIETSTGSYALSFPEDQEKTMIRLFRQLGKGGKTVDELSTLCPEIDQFQDLIAQFDSMRLITESEFLLPDGLISGAQLDREIQRVNVRRQNQLGKSKFYTALCDGSATRRQIMGYALEYFWLVREAPSLIAPSLATSPNQVVRKILQEFLATELNHDQYLLDALKSAGLKDELTYLQPLPTTFQICASLGVYAQMHPLSFKAALFLFEQAQPVFLEAFENRCKELNIPAEFYVPLKKHSDINEDADHGNISTLLLSHVPIVDREEQDVVKKNIAILVETMLLQEEQIVDYYGDPQNPMPRIYE